MLNSYSEINNKENVNSFVVIDNRSKTVVFKKNLSKQLLIRGIAWSPDSTMFALLSEKDSTDIALGYMIGGMVGHPACASGSGLCCLKQ